MWRSKKFIVGAVLAAVLLAGSIGGIALAADNEDGSQPSARFGALLDKVCTIYNANPDSPGDIDCDLLKTAFAEARSEMQGEIPDRIRAPRARDAGISECLVDKFGIDLDAWKAAMADARERIQAGEDRQEVMTGVLEGFGIDVEELKATCVGDADGKRPFKSGFMGPRGHGGFRGFGGRCAPAE